MIWNHRIKHISPSLITPVTFGFSFLSFHNSSAAPPYHHEIQSTSTPSPTPTPQPPLPSSVTLYLTYRLQLMSTLKLASKKVRLWYERLNTGARLTRWHAHWSVSTARVLQSRWFPASIRIWRWFLLDISIFLCPASPHPTTTTTRTHPSSVVRLNMSLFKQKNKDT